MAPAAPAPAPPKKPGERAAKRLETARAASNPAGVRKVVRLLGTQADAVVRGSDDLSTTARIIARVTAAMPQEALVVNGIVPVRTRGKNPRNLGVFEVGLQAKDAVLMTAYIWAIIQPCAAFSTSAAGRRFS